jgi:uncharacterized RDD family membrane protein YckC
MITCPNCSAEIPEGLSSYLNCNLSTNKPRDFAHQESKLGGFIFKDTSLPRSQKQLVSANRKSLLLDLIIIGLIAKFTLDISIFEANVPAEYFQIDTFRSNWYRDGIELLEIQYFLFQLCFNPVSVLVYIFFDIFMIRLIGKTPGMIFFQLKVIRLDGQKLQWENIFIRFFVKTSIAVLCILLFFKIPFWGVFFLPIGVVFLIYSAKGKNWHDQLARTTIIDTRAKRQN